MTGSAFYKCKPCGFAWSRTKLEIGGDLQPICPRCGYQDQGAPIVPSKPGPHTVILHDNSRVAELERALLDRARDDRQAQVSAWARAAFGEIQATNLAQRGVRLLEEAIEAFQACGGDAAKAHELVDFVFDRPPGELGQELGGIGVTLLALAAAAGLSAEQEEVREVNRVFSKPLEHFTARNAAKNAAGFLVVADAQDPIELDDCETCLGHGRIRDGGTGSSRRCLDCGGSGKEIGP